MNVFSDRYDIRERLGSGALAVVYRAVDLDSKRTVALKVLHENLASDETVVKRLELEAEIAGELDHPNIVEVVDVVADDGCLALILEYVDGGDMKQAVLRDGPLSVSELVSVGVGVAKALSAAHERGIVHCDVKPHNILGEPGRFVKLGDFGFARCLGRRPGFGRDRLVGTPEYMAPERATNKRPGDSRSDLYSLGATLYELATGRPPFLGNSAHEVRVV